MNNKRKTALITGGTQGIGYAIAETLACGQEYELILTYATHEQEALRAQDRLSQQTRTHILQADISTKDSIETIYAFLEKNDISLDALILNAGLTLRDNFESMRPEDWERVMYANVQYPVFLIQRILGNMNPGSAIICTGSAMGLHPHAMSLAYGVSKSAVHALVKNLVKTLAPYRIRVNAIAPGFVSTEWQRNKPEEIKRNIEKKIALGRFARPDEISGIYKTAIENPYLNGEIIVVDGGYSYI